MQRLAPKQINKVIGTKLKSNSYTNTLAMSDVVTTIINSQLTTLNLLNQNSSGVNNEGVDNNYLCEIFYNTEKTPVYAPNGSQVFGLLSKSGAIWTIAYKYYNYQTSAIANYTFNSANSLFISFLYRMQLKDYNFNNIDVYNPKPGKIITYCNNISTIVIPYNSNIFGQLPIIQFWDSVKKQMAVIQAEVDDIINPTTISIDFGELMTGYLVIG
jgi:hypothetical protein